MLHEEPDTQIPNNFSVRTIKKIDRKAASVSSENCIIAIADFLDGELRHRKIKRVTKGHTDSLCKKWKLNLVLLSDSPVP